MWGRMKRGIITIAMAALSLAGCQTTQTASREAADGYKFRAAEYRKLDVSVRVFEYKSLGELRRNFPGKLPSHEHLRVFSYLLDDICEIHMVAPEVDYSPEWVGHEITHCVYGRWHRPVVR